MPTLLTRLSLPIRVPLPNLLRKMSRRALSSSPTSDLGQPNKRPRLDSDATRQDIAVGERDDQLGLTSEDFKGGVMLAPMVRSGALATRLFALKHGAKLVWGPEVVDRAILISTRVVDPSSGAISYLGTSPTSKPIFTTHPLERPHLIYQLGSSSPELALQAALKVLPDVSGIDLNCGCPKPFSTSGGMGAALLSTPDLLCSILTTLRSNLPAHISVSAKIRLLATDEETCELVRRIVGTGVSAVTVHCRTRSMRNTERALVGRLREVVRAVEGTGTGVAVIANGDCVGWEDAKRVRDVTGAHSVMIATAAESNPTCFSPTPLINLERTLIPDYVRLCSYLKTHFASTKFCISQFKAPHPLLSKSDFREFKDKISRGRTYADYENVLFGGHAEGKVGLEDGEEVFRAIERAVRARTKERGFSVLEAPSSSSTEDGSDDTEIDNEATADDVENTNGSRLATPPPRYLPPGPPPVRNDIGNEVRISGLPPAVSLCDAPTPTPGGGFASM